MGIVTITLREPASELSIDLTSLSDWHSVSQSEGSVQALLASKGDRLPQKANSTRPIVRLLSVTDLPVSDRLGPQRIHLIGDK